MKRTLDHSPHHCKARRISSIELVATLFALNFGLMLFMGRSIYILAPVVSVQVYLLEAAFIVSSVSALLALRGLRSRWSERRTASYILLAALWLPVAPLLHIVLPERFSYVECLSVQDYVFPLTPCGGNSGLGPGLMQRQE